MEQHGQAQDFVGPDGLYRADGMLPDREAVVGVILGRLHAAVELGQEVRCQAGLIGCAQQLRMGGSQEFCQFGIDPFQTDPVQIGRQLFHGCPGLRFNGKTENSRETDSPHDPEGVFREARAWISYRPDQSFLQILQPSEQVHNAFRMVVSHGVDGKIPSLQILLQTAGKDHLTGVSAVLIFTVDTVGGHFKAFTALQDRDRSVLETGINGPGKKRFDLPGLRGSGYVPVIRLPAHNGVTDTAAHHICLKARFMDRIQDRGSPVRDPDLYLF